MSRNRPDAAEGDSTARELRRLRATIIWIAVAVALVFGAYPAIKQAEEPRQDHKEFQVCTYPGDPDFCKEQADH